MSCMYLCDICGKEVKSLGSALEINIKKEYYEKDMTGWLHVDLCCDCLKKLMILADDNTKRKFFIYEGGANET